ncbi:MAG: hypothetical protein PHP95_11180 [Desulfuromonadaceae bacterium]|nr:hypothetical protein [Desulfuromonadaceae bacterium]MDD2849009.1 hypothetical protein [Desulfuromonadaceae bacterium]MDD4131834.1 hypothetical protein [Desulfuromonadaceae bacterium]
MSKQIIAQVAAMALLATPVLAQEVVAPTVTSKYNVSIGGYVKLDYINNSTSLGSTGAGIAALGSLQPGGIPKSSSVASTQNQSLFTARQSRLWVKVNGPDYEGAKTSAYVEGDFFGNSTSNESGSFRMRHAYGTLDWKDTQILFGQFWDNFGSGPSSTYDFGHGATTGNPGSPRVAQLKVTQKVSLSDQTGLKLIVALQNPVQDDFVQTAAGSSGDMVNVVGKVELTNKALGVAPGFWGMPMRPLTFGLFGQYGNDKIDGKQYDSYGYGVLAFVPILKSSNGKSREMTASFEGQAYMAANMSATHATAAALVGPAGDKSPAKGYGLFAQVIFYPTQDVGVTVGYGKRNAYDYASYASNVNYQKNSSQIYTNIAYDLNAAVRVAAEYQHLTTQYGNVANGTGNLAGMAEQGIDNVVRLSAMYFF